MRRAIDIMRSFIAPSMRYVFNNDGIEQTFDTWLVEYILQWCDQPTITLSQIRRSARRQLSGLSPWAAADVIMSSAGPLENHNWLMRIDDGKGETRGIVEWAINPAIQTQFAQHRAEVVRAKQRVLDSIYKLSTKPKPRARGIDDFPNGNSED